MLRVCFAAAVLVLVNLAGVQCKYCTNLDIRVDFANFDKLRGCRVVVGKLYIVLFDRKGLKHQDYIDRNITFPELEEVQGHVVLYRVYGLTTLADMFPNLSIIRGNTLLRDYSLILFNLPELEEIGLKSLVYMPRGEVYIQKCAKLCYANNIDWAAIGPKQPTIVEGRDQVRCADTCPSHCHNGRCWNHSTCQTMRSKSCPPDCSICTEESKKRPSRKCIACNSLSDSGVCVRKCPPNKFRHALIGSCVNETECTSLIEGVWWTFKGDCIATCPYGYLNVTKEDGWCKPCNGSCKLWYNVTTESKIFTVDSKAQAQILHGKTHINGSLSIRIDSDDSKALFYELEQHLGAIEEITGFLKISRSKHITSLSFFKNLTVIHGEMLENMRNSLIVYDNQNLQNLWDWGNFSLTIKRGTMSFHYNPQLCISEIETLAQLTKQSLTKIDVSHLSNGDKRACSFVDLHPVFLEITPTNATLQWDNYTAKVDNTVVGYQVYYMEKQSDNVTLFGQSDCGDDGWSTIFVSNNVAVLLNLKPFREYAYYIKAYVSIPEGGQWYTHAGGQTNLTYFRTKSDDPSPPRNIIAFSTSSNSIRLKWLPPEQPNGNLSHYHVIGFLEQDDPDFVSQRDYCLYPPSEEGREAEKEDSSIQQNFPLNESACLCSGFDKATREDFDVLCDSIISIHTTTDSNLLTGGCKRYMYSQENKELYKGLMPASEKREGYLKEDQHIDQIAPANATSLDIPGLRRFSLYVFLISACNQNQSEHVQCSAPILIFQRTKRDARLDDIYRGAAVTVKGTSAVVSWNEPVNPNSMIMAYQIEHKRTDLDDAKPRPECVTRDEHRQSNFEYELKNLLPGKYAVRVKAVSLAGPGNFCDYYHFEIDDESKSSAWLILLLIAFLLVFLLIGGVYLWFKRKRKMDMLHLIASINPDYAGPMYVEDEWEIDRDDIEILSPLGNGTFGMVYNGRIKSRNLHCAVKTVNETTKVHDRMEFLNEAAVMKSFSNAHHVVKLLGVVSRESVPLVVMELMQRGDLKSYLRKSRDSSNSITCAEMYRMAAEIADGMAYLAAKKFVHRDLAARNCMVSADRTVKIGDFGMTRDIYENDYYRKESRGLLPVRWMAPESLADGMFTTDSDVWSYGVVLWEMATLAEQPYQGLANEQVLQYVINKGTLERPLECPDLLYEIMAACWKWRPSHRPQFFDIVDKLESHVGQDFRLVSFYHSREGEEYRLNCRHRIENMPALYVKLDDNNSVVRWTASDDDISVSSDHPNELIPYSHQREDHSQRSSNFH